MIVASLERAKLLRTRARLEAAVDYAIGCMDRIDAEIEGLEDDEREIVTEDDGLAVAA